MAIAVITLLVTAIAALATAISLYLQNAQLKRDLRRETEYKRNAADHRYALDCILSVGRKWIIQSSTGQGAGFDLMFPDRDLVRRITMYLGSRDSIGDFTPYQLTDDHLRNPECCRTIQDVCAAVERARQEEWAIRLSLPSKPEGKC